jgi:hypothetical protein
MSDGTTHYAGCIQAGPKHYECALQEIGRLRLTITDLRVKLEKKEWVGLTEEEINKYFLDNWARYYSYHGCFREVMRWQEERLKEKNT